MGASSSGTRVGSSQFVPNDLLVMRHPAPLVRGLCAGRYEIQVEDASDVAIRLVAQLKERPVEYIRTSPSTRCIELASALARYWSIPLESDARLRELDFGEWEGRFWSEIATNDAERFESWCARWQVAAPPGGESLPELEARVLAATTDLPQERTLLVTHAGPIRVLRVHARGLPWSDSMSLTVPYAVALSLGEL